jgi:hypothetical protein
MVGRVIADPSLNLPSPCGVVPWVPILIKIPMFRLAPSRPFSGVGLGSIILYGSISLLMSFGMPDNYRTKSVIFDIVEVNLPFNAILGRSTLYRILKMPSPSGIIKVCGDRSVGVSALEKLQALVADQEAATGHGG